MYFGFRVVLVSRNANNSSKAGVFIVNANDAWSNANTNYGTQLCLLYNITKYINLASWQNTKQSLIQFSRLILKKLEVK